MTHRPSPLLALLPLTLAACASAPPPDVAAPQGVAPTSASQPAAAGAVVEPTIDAALRRAVAGAHRPAKESARDAYRHPVETLEFFGLKDDMTVVELSPGGGWYSAILAPTLREHGKFITFGSDPGGDPKSELTQNAKELAARFAASPQVFDRVKNVYSHGKDPVVLGPPESAEMVLTFRNFHNWVGGEWMNKILAASFAVLKHGGILGLTDHRARAGAPVDPKTVDDTGYVTEDLVIQTIEKAGFKLAGRSEINANPRDTKDYPKGVWVLPPTFELGATDHAKYAAIGESDRMTLKFVKP